MRTYPGGLVLPTFNGVTLIPYKIHPESVRTDASMKGFGAVYGKQWLLGVWNGEDLKDLVIDSPCEHIVKPPSLSPEDSSNINVMELWAVVVALEKWSDLYRNQTVVLYIDNRQVICMLSNGASINSQWLRPGCANFLGHYEI